VSTLATSRRTRGRSRSARQPARPPPARLVAGAAGVVVEHLAGSVASAVALGGTASTGARGARYGPPHVDEAVGVEVRVPVGSTTSERALRADLVLEGGGVKGIGLVAP
jgi:hypothetical protein